MIRNRMFATAWVVLALAVIPAAGHRVNVDTLNVRSGPGGSYAPVGTLSKGTIVNTVGTSGSWTKIDGPKTGWVYSAYLTGETHVRYVNATSGANVRTGPGTGYALVKTLAYGIRVNLVSAVNGWARIDSPVAGYVSTSALGTGAPGGTSSDYGASNGNPYGLSSSSIGFLQLPGSGTGFSSYMSSYRQWGLPRMINGIISLGRRWKTRNLTSARIGVGDISLAYGGYFYPHSSHQNGWDADFALFRNDHVEGATTWYSSTYSRYLNQQFVYEARKMWSVYTILFNDPYVSGVQYYSGHDNHMHVSIY